MTFSRPTRTPSYNRGNYRPRNRYHRRGSNYHQARSTYRHEHGRRSFQPEYGRNYYGPQPQHRGNRAGTNARVNNNPPQRVESHSNRSNVTHRQGNANVHRENTVANVHHENHVANEFARRLLNEPDVSVFIFSFVL